jgi:hypothetical protein
MPDPKGWRLSRSSLLRLLGQAGQKPANAKELTDRDLERLASRHRLISTASLCDLPDQVSATSLHSLRSCQGDIKCTVAKRRLLAALGPLSRSQELNVVIKASLHVFWRTEAPIR